MMNVSMDPCSQSGETVMGRRVVMLIISVGRRGNIEDPQSQGEINRVNSQTICIRSKTDRGGQLYGLAWSGSQARRERAQAIINSDSSSVNPVRVNRSGLSDLPD